MKKCESPLSSPRYLTNYVANNDPHGGKQQKSTKLVLTKKLRGHDDATQDLKKKTDGPLTTTGGNEMRSLSLQYRKDILIKDGSLPEEDEKKLTP